MSGLTPDNDKQKGKASEPSLSISSQVGTAPTGEKLILGGMGKNLPPKNPLYSQAASPGYAPKYAGGAKEAPPAKLSWADLAEAEDLTEELQKRLEAIKTDLLYAIRSKTSLTTENRILVPGNLQKELPDLYEKFAIAAGLAKCEIVGDNSVTIEVARKMAFSNDIVARDQVLAALYDEKGKPKKELVHIADFTALVDSVLEIPDPSQIEEPLGKQGILHTYCSFLRIYCEQMYNAPIAKQKHWWKGGQLIRTDMIERVKTVVGNEPAAQCIVNAFDILYRKFIRSVIRENKDDKMEKLANVANFLSKKLFVSGSGLFNNLLHTETRTKKEPITSTKGGRSKTEVREVKYTARIKPHIADGPKTALEATVFSKVNMTLSKADTLAEDFYLGSGKFLNDPKEWEKEHKEWIESLYSKCKTPSNEIVKRKQLVRARVNAIRQKKSEESSGQKATPSQPQPISPDEWREAEAQVIAENQESFESASFKALSNIFSKLEAKSLADFEEESEDRLLPCLSYKFTVSPKDNSITVVE